MDTSLDKVKTNIINLIVRVNEAEQLSPLIKDGLDIIGSSSTLFELAKEVYQYSKRRQFDEFVKAMSNKIHTDPTHPPLNAEELNKFFNNPDNLEHMSQIIDTCLHSQSIKCSSILGYYAGELLTQKNQFEYKDTIVVNALRIMNDRDLINFIKLYKFVQTRPDLLEEQKESQSRTCDIQKDLLSLDIPIFELELTIEKLKGVQAIGYDAGGYDRVGYAWGTFKFNENTVYLFGLVSKFNQLILPPSAIPISSSPSQK
jgi:hypothetical protein